MKDVNTAPQIDRSSRSPISVALLAGLACVPIVVAVGFLTEDSGPAVPSDVSIAALRGALDHGPAERPRPERAGY